MAFSDLTAVKMDLNNVLYLSYRVPSDRIRPLLPRVLSLIPDEMERVYVSFVGMRCRRVRLSGLPWPRFDYDQLNLRTYVTDPKTGEAAVYFFRSGVSLGIVPVLTRLMGIPWERISFNLASISRQHFRGWGDWSGEFAFEIDSPSGDLPPDSLIQHLTGPMMGFMGPEGKIRSFRINHRALEVQPAVLKSITFPLSTAQGLITENELNIPDSVLLVPKAEFTVYLPPRRAG